MSYRTRNVLAAAGLGLLAIVFMLVYISKARSNSSKPAQAVSVLIAKHDIPAGTLGSTLQEGDFKTELVPSNAALSDGVANRGQIAGQVVTQDILSGEQVSSRHFGPVAASGVRSQIRRDQRVVQLVGDPSQVLDGTLKAGDHVDVLGTWTMPETCGQCHVSRTIVRNALVLRTSTDLGTETSSSSSGQQGVPVQIRLTDAQAERVFWMVKNGQWWLALRPVLHPSASKQGFDNSATILQAGLSRRGPSR